MNQKFIIERVITELVFLCSPFYFYNAGLWGNCFLGRKGGMGGPEWPLGNIGSKTEHTGHQVRNILGEISEVVLHVSSGKLCVTHGFHPCPAPFLFLSPLIPIGELKVSADSFTPLFPN